MHAAFFHSLKAGSPLVLAGIAIIFASPLGAAERPVSFAGQIAPILLEQCQTCHGPTEQKGGYRVDTFEFLSHNEDADTPALAPGKPDHSALYTLLVAEDADDRMPQKAASLSKQQTDLVKRWIAEGALFDGGDKAAALVEIVPPRVHPKAPETYKLPVPVSALAFSPDGSELFVGGFRELTVWNVSDGKLLRRITNVAPRTFALSFSPDGATIAAASGAPGEYGEVRFFDAKTGEMRKQLLSSADAILDVKYAANGQWLATAGADHNLSIFEVATGTRRHRLSGHSDAVTAVAISPDSKHVASVSLDRTAKVFDAGSGKLMATYHGHQAALFAVAFSPEGSHVLSAGRDQAVHQWQLAKPQEKDPNKKRDRIEGLGEVLKLLVNGEHFYFGASTGKLMQVRTSDLTPERPFDGVHDWIYSLAIHPASQRIAAGCYDGTVMIWNLTDGKPVTRFVASPGFKEEKSTAGNASATHR